MVGGLGGGRCTCSFVLALVWCVSGCMLLHRLFIDQRRAQQRLEVGRKVQAVTEDGEEDPAGAFR